MKGKGSLSLKWNFVLTDNLCGFYRSKYVDIDGTEKVMAVTQFEATDAPTSQDLLMEAQKQALEEGERLGLAGTLQTKAVPTSV